MTGLISYYYNTTLPIFTNILSFFYVRTDVINEGDFSIQIDISKLCISRVSNISHTIRYSQFKVEILFAGNVRLLKRVFFIC